MSSSPSPNPFFRSTDSDPRHDKFEEAWRLKSRGDVQPALERFTSLIEECHRGSRAYVTLLGQIAVCHRVAREFIQAERAFRDTYSFALGRHLDIAFSTLLDWSALLLDQKRSEEAVDMLQETVEHSDDRLQYARAEAYLGHALGRIRGRRREALAHQQDAANVLRGESGFEDLHLDNLIWMLEIWLWSPRARFECAVEAVKLAYDLRYIGRMVDVGVTFIGGRPAREVLRRLAQLAGRFKR